MDKKTKRIVETEVIKDEAGETQKIVKETVVTPKKRGVVERLVIGMIGPNGLRGIGRYVGQEIVGPALKNTLADIITSATNMALFGENRENYNTTRNGSPNKSYWNGPNAPTTNYSTGKNYYSNTSYPERSQRTNYGRNEPVNMIMRGSKVPDYIIGTRREAADVLDGLRDYIAQYSSASVADYYDMLGINSEYTDNNFGWDDLGSAAIIGVRNGYVIKLPPVEVI